MELSTEQKIDKALAKIEGHENVCAVRYENIESILEDRGTRLGRLEGWVIAIYPFFITLLLALKYFE